MEIAMKVKRFAVERIPIEVECARPIAVRLFLLFHLHKMIKHVKVQPVIAGKPVCKPIHMLYIPQIEVKRHDKK